ncbi:hypothetical protein LUX02_11810 [Streptomyces somaliensis]|nr:hypothetical protein [Streptomyces somaliensis]
MDAVQEDGPPPAGAGPFDGEAGTGQRDADQRHRVVPVRRRIPAGRQLEAGARAERLGDGVGVDDAHVTTERVAQGALFVEVPDIARDGHQAQPRAAERSPGAQQPCGRHAAGQYGRRFGGEEPPQGREPGAGGRGVVVGGEDEGAAGAQGPHPVRRELRGLGRGRVDVAVPGVEAVDLLPGVPGGGEVVVADPDEPGPPRRPGGEEHARGAAAGGRRVHLAARACPAPARFRFGVHAHHPAARPAADLRPVRLAGEHDVGTGLLQDAVEFRVGHGGVERQVGALGPEDAQHGDEGGDRPVQRDGDQPTLRQARGPQAVGLGVHEAAQLPVADPSRAAHDRLGRRGGLRPPRHQLVHALPVGRCTIRRHQVPLQSAALEGV